MRPDYKMAHAYLFCEQRNRLWDEKYSVWYALLYTVPILHSLYPYCTHCTHTTLTVPVLHSLYPYCTHCTHIVLTVLTVLTVRITLTVLTVLTVLTILTVLTVLTVLTILTILGTPCAIRA
jgi:hypothetical protein